MDEKTSGGTAPVSEEPADNPVAGICGAAEPAEAEKTEDAAAAFGKFRSAEALMQAYKNLEAEFTRRSQRLKELESKVQNGPSSNSLEGEELLKAALADEGVKNAVVGEYLKRVLSGKCVPLTVGGVPCAAPKSEPASVKEAGALAKQFLKD